MMTIFRCQDSFEGILSGVYDAWSSRLGHENVKLEVEAEETPELFAEYIEVPPDEEKAKKVIISVQNKISKEAYDMIFKASLSYEKEKPDRIYRFLVDGFRYGRKITQMLKEDSVFHIFALDRNVSNEAHLLLGFVRFSQTGDGILVSKITPKNNVLPLIAPHFADRLSGEDWMIYDVKRKRAALHQKNKGWILADLNAEQGNMALAMADEKDMFQELWKVFFQTIAIKERINPRCQRTHLPIRYRGNMLEFPGNN